jgi:hypothetical protein
MPSVTFWNCQRLSGNPQNFRVAKLEKLLKGRISDANILCEVLPGATEWDPINATYRKKTNTQLCYAVLDNELESLAPAVTMPDLVITDSYRTLAFKGGCTPSNVMSRRPIQLDVSGVQVFAFHAPASHKAIRSVAMIYDHILYHVQQKAIDKWLLIGDLNCLPEDFMAAVASWKWPADTKQFTTGVATHGKNAASAAAGSNDKISGQIDWAVGNVPNLTLTAKRSGAASDHLMIRAVWK